MQCDEAGTRTTSISRVAKFASALASGFGVSGVALIGSGGWCNNCGDRTAAATRHNSGICAGKSWLVCGAARRGNNSRRRRRGGRRRSRKGRSAAERQRNVLGVSVATSRLWFVARQHNASLRVFVVCKKSHSLSHLQGNCRKSCDCLLNDTKYPLSINYQEQKQYQLHFFFFPFFFSSTCQTTPLRWCPSRLNRAADQKRHLCRPK